MIRRTAIEGLPSLHRHIGSLLANRSSPRDPRVSAVCRRLRLHERELAGLGYTPALSVGREGDHVPGAKQWPCHPVEAQARPFRGCVTSRRRCPRQRMTSHPLLRLSNRPTEAERRVNDAGVVRYRPSTCRQCRETDLAAELVGAEVQSVQRSRQVREFHRAREPIVAQVQMDPPGSDVAAAVPVNAFWFRNRTARVAGSDPRSTDPVNSL